MKQENQSIIYASIQERNIAIFIDFILLGVLGMLVFYTLVLSHHDSKLTLFVLLMNLLFTLKDFNGQSIGKRIIKIKIVKKNDLSNPGILLPFVRNISIALGLGVIEEILMITNNNHERLGDKIAKTIVIKQ
jgi:uncharacterized RDD family membrane protein YckC